MFGMVLMITLSVNFDNKKWDFVAESYFAFFVYACSCPLWYCGVLSFTLNLKAIEE